MELEAASNGELTPGDATTRWEGYSNYQLIAWQLAKDVNRAMKAGAKIQRYHQEDARVEPEVAAEASARLLTPALQFIPEMQAQLEIDDVEVYEEVLERWLGEEGETGIVKEIAEHQFTETSPGFILDYLLDLKRVGWELGYLKSGRMQSQPEDPVEAEAIAMVEGG